MVDNDHIIIVVLVVVALLVATALCWAVTHWLQRCRKNKTRWDRKSWCDEKDIYTHKCVDSFWGHTCHFEVGTLFEIREGGQDDGAYWKCNGHLTPTVKAGDRVVKETKEGRYVVYQFVEVRNVRDPHDMFFATVASMAYCDKDGNLVS